MKSFDWVQKLSVIVFLILIGLSLGYYWGQHDELNANLETAQWYADSVTVMLDSANTMVLRANRKLELADSIRNEFLISLKALEKVSGFVLESMEYHVDWPDELIEWNKGDSK